jgi:PIN domain nuclease of toxin-antitoxin system
MAEREIVFLDTHVVVWLFEGRKVFSKRAIKLMNQSDLRISPIVRLELQMLHQINRIDHPFIILSSLKEDFYFEEEKVDFSQLITQSLNVNFTRDPFDRLLVAHTQLLNRKLVTKDSDILENCNNGVW